METTFRMTGEQATGWRLRHRYAQRAWRKAIRDKAEAKAKRLGADVAVIVDTKGRQVDTVEVKK